MTVLEVIQRSSRYLADKGVDSPRLQVELLLASALRMPRLQLYLNFQRELSTDELDHVRQRIVERGRRIPLQHIVGSISFCGLEIKVSPQALIPRPETEMLAEHAWKFLNQAAAPQRGLEIGTGTGCIAIALAHFAPGASILATDISWPALELAAANRDACQVRSRVELIQADGLNAFQPQPAFDLIVSNPPYIPSAEILSLAPEVRDHDPKLALDGGADGLDFYRRFAQHAHPLLRRGGKLMLEFGDGQSAALHALFTAPPWSGITILQDDTHRPRFLIAS